MQAQAVAWEGEDTDDNQYVVRIYGRADTGQSVCATVPFDPYFFIKIRPTHNITLLTKSLTEQFGDFKSLSEIRAKDLWGFRNQLQERFAKVTFTTLRGMRICASVLDRGEYKNFGKLKIYESNIDPVLRFMHVTDIRSTGWFKISGGVQNFSSTCQFDIWDPTLEPVDRDDIAPLKIMSFDIECYSSTGEFPDPHNKQDVVFQIGMTTRVFGTDTLERKCLCLKETDADDCESFVSELDLLKRFEKYLVQTDPDIITGWNIFGFDLEYLQVRSVMSGLAPTWGRYKNSVIELVSKNLSSSALGNNLLKMVPMRGRYVFDFFQDVKREHKLESYSLNNVSKHFLKDQKNDMPVKEIFSRYAEGDPKRLGEVAEYCLQDTVLPHKLLDKLCQLQNQIEMAKACWVPLSFLSERGQQIKVFSQMAYKARKLGFLIPYFKKTGPPGPDEKYQGATVLDAQAGAYYSPITALDFASLYPSIMCAHNLCYSTLVMDPQFDNLPGVEYEQFGQFRFAQNTSSLLPVILMDLKAYRKKAKKLMAETEGTPMEAIYNGQQLAYKISMNSIYGFTGASKGMLPCVAIASTVTMRGRQMIDETKTYVEANFPGAKVRYGDSVMPGTPVLVRGSEGIRVRTIESIAESWTEYPGFLKEGTNKEQSEIECLEVWTHHQWQPIKRVIRHKCQKKIYRVLTHTGLVDVTEDHSLLDWCQSSEELILLKPVDVRVGQKLYHSFPDNLGFDEVCSTDEAFVLGMFVGDGSCGSYECPSGLKSSWAINNKDIKLLEKCKEYCEKIHPGYDFVIMDTLESSGVYKLSPRGGSVIDLVKLYREQCYDGQSKKVPIKAFGRNAQAFLDGLWASDGCRKDAETTGCHRIDTKNQVTAQWYYLFLRHMGCFKVSLNTRSDKPDVFRLTWTKGRQRKDPEAIKKIEVLHESWDGYVYDLETNAGTFQAGVGQMIVKNTDSVMVEFDVQGRKGQEAIDYSWELGEQAAEQCTGLFKKPNELELEKVYYPYFLYSKKRYAAKMYEKKKGKVIFKKIDVKGLQVVRRDSCPYVRETLKQLLEMILESDDPRPPVEFAKQAAKVLTNGEVPMSKLLMSKQLAANYKVKMPHVEVRNKIRERAPGSEPQQGDRVQFVIVEGPKNAKMFEKAEDPDWVQENGIKIDYQYYFTNQLKKPVCDLLEPLLGKDTEKLIFQPKVRKITEFFTPRQTV